MIGSALRDAAPRHPECPTTGDIALVTKAERIVAGEMQFFRDQWWSVGSPPKWLWDPWARRSWSAADTHWSDTREFVTPGVDIKAVWEQSRFEWAVILARAYAVTARDEFLQTLCLWLDSWAESNPANAGANWKCGQEASIRLLRFLEALHCISWRIDALPALQFFVIAHLRRIEATLSYAIGQDNNHGTSEAAALFVGGHWLLCHCAEGEVSRLAANLAHRGERQLVERIMRLVSSDGTFSQYSVNYHRMFIDTIAIAEAWRRRLGASAVFERCMPQINAAIEWLSTMVDAASGDAPNIGANDGTALLISPATTYRDYRPTLQLISCLMRGERHYPSGAWDGESRCWGIEPDYYPHVPSVRRSRVFMPGGFAMLVGDSQCSWGVLRVPSYRFRPSQADALHFDLWIDGENVIRDTGTFSYNSGEHWHRYFSGTRGHSTCEFDGRDQMPRLGRFLFSDWPTCDELSIGGERDLDQEVTAAYTDYCGAWHRRSVAVHGARWVIQDEVSGFKHNAVIRWHLAPGQWTLFGQGVVSSHVRIEIESGPDIQLRLVEGGESRCYLHKTAAPMFEIELKLTCRRLRTTITTIA